jgi:hypothetical protein
MVSLIATAYILFYIALIAGIFYFIYNWVMRYFKLKEEQNQILREISDKLGHKNNP